MIKLVLFDGNGVIYTKNSKVKKIFKKLEQETGFKNVKKAFDLIKTCLKKNEFTRVELFKRLTKIINSKSDPKELEQEYTNMRNQEFKALPGVKQTLKKLKNKGLKIGLLSDGIYTSQEKSKWLKRIRVREYFDYIFTSRDLGYTKIYPECYKKVLEKTSYKKNEVLMVGHQLKDLIGAILLDIKTISLKEEIKTAINLKEITEVINQL